ncbi:MAG: class I SAM-dependent methyltransferase [Anaerolineae bacterium]|nr:class I SAM-dependent methyltransferase [Anaerolineae bacterium]
MLDVGGRVGLLQRFTPYPVVTVNPDMSGDVAGSGRALPFGTGTYAAVVSIDTLEHLPSADRLPFLDECLRVARRCVVVAAPYGSDGHRAAEVRMNDEYAVLHGKPHPYLAEHVRYGLPGEEEVRAWLATLDTCAAHALYAGDYRWQGAHFRRATLGYGAGLPARVRRLWDRIQTSALVRPVRLSKAPYPEANRFYLGLVKTPK